MTVTVTEVIRVNRGRGRASGSRSNRDARANNQYKPAIYLVLIWLSILDTHLSAISYRHIIRLAWFKNERHVQEHNTYPVCDITSYP
jgi:hypothetical protein